MLVVTISLHDERHISFDIMSYDTAALFFWRVLQLVSVSRFVEQHYTLIVGWQAK